MHKSLIIITLYIELLTIQKSSKSKYGYKYWIDLKFYMRDKHNKNSLSNDEIDKL